MITGLAETSLTKTRAARFRHPNLELRTMVGPAFIGASILALLSSVSACSCLFPPPLSECAVRENEAALLVRVVAKKTFQCTQFDGTAIADVLITRVFKDNTDLDLKRGTVVSVESSTQGSLCGFGLEPGTQYILFANAPFMSDDDAFELEPVEIAAVPAADNAADDDEEPAKPSRRLLKTATVRITASATDGGSVRARGFSDGDTCEIPSGDLRTSLCSGNVVDPKRKDVEALAAGCAATMEMDDDDKEDA